MGKDFFTFNGEKISNGPAIPFNLKKSPLAFPLEIDFPWKC